MRMRKKPNLQPRMEKAGRVQIINYKDYKGAWRESFPQYEKIEVELGCGKGRFTVETAKLKPNTLIVAVEKVPDAMVMAMERAVAENIENVRFIDCDVLELGEIFAPGEIDGIYINFCDPWPKNRDAKHRLTAPDFQRIYASILNIGGKIWFKTDNLPLFNWSEEMFKGENWSLSEITRDLHKDRPNGVMTDYEERFYAQGTKINRLVTEKTEKTKTAADGSYGRIHEASLLDENGNVLHGTGLPRIDYTPKAEEER